MQAYLDNSATTCVCKEAIDAMMKALTENWGNPSSLHQKGIDAEEILLDARAALSQMLGCGRDEIYLTSGGTQSNNIALFGAANAMKRKGGKIIISAVEHPSVSKAADRLESDGFEVVRLSVDRHAKINLRQLEEALDEKTILVSIMAVNNELGTIEPIEQAAKIIKAHSNALFHVDAVQAFGKIPLQVKKIGCDMMSVSSHKIHGPKGAGALYIRNGVRIVSPICGGGQEKDIRPGTEPMPAIAGFGAAIRALKVRESLERLTALRDGFVSSLSKIDGVVINSDENSLPYIVNISLPGLPSEAVLNLLSDMEIYVSSGSACAKGHKSPVLTAAGLENELINSSVRISLSRFTTKEELDYFIGAIEKALKIIRRK